MSHFIMYYMKHFACFIALLCCINLMYGQHQYPELSCATDALHLEMFRAHPELAEREARVEQQYRETVTLQSRSAASLKYTLPVVVHIIHDNGPENISDAQVLQGITYLNDAFRNRNYYNPQTGVDTEIEFCLAKRDPAGNAINGILRYQSPITDMSTHFSHSQLYNLTNWDTENYINITLVREVCIGGQCKAAGYATFASVQGTPGDGIVMEAEYFGKNAAESTVIVHEMGHYLGLHHTFLGGCKNDNCLQDGDAVCDTPPDNVAGFFPCSANFNSCSTDSGDPSAHNPYRSLALGGLGDQPDMNRNYMDYTPQWCRDQFTTGQRARMQFFIENVRTLLMRNAEYGMMRTILLDIFA